jgi:plastocyanin
MFVSTLSLGLAILPFVSAAVHDVTVGPDGKLEFYPYAIGAAVGDQVVFHFASKNHTVTQSTLEHPCERGPEGFDSGFMPVPANQTDNLPTFTVEVTTTKPIWVFCNQAAKTPNTHCGKGMVFAINCGQTGAPNSIENFKAAALAHGASLAAPPSSTSDGYGNGYGNGGTKVYTAPYGGVTVPPPAQGVVVTKSITVEGSSWVTTYTSFPNSPAPTPASLKGREITVVVGGPSGLIFDPPHVEALPRDVIKFQFLQKNHTATQSSFEDPCRPLAGGFDSGFFPVGADVTEFPTWSVTINDTAPTWIYCRQRNPQPHCGQGMVFAINPDQKGPRNFEAFKQIAAALNGTSAGAAGPQQTVDSSGVAARIGGTGLITVVVILFTLLL